MSDEKVALLRVVRRRGRRVPDRGAARGPAQSYYSTAERLVRETPGAFRPDQYSNPANPRAHERTTGPEIWRPDRGPRHALRRRHRHRRHDHRRRARTLKAQNPRVQIVGADPSGSVYSGGTGRPYLVEGVGEDFWPTTFDPSARRPRRRGERRGLVPHRAPRHARGRAAHRRLVRHRGARRARGRARARARRCRRRAAARLRPQLPVEDLRRPLDVRHGLPARRRPDRRRRARGARAASSPTSC